MILGRPRHHFDEIDSTSAELKRLARAGAAIGTVVTADAQSAGYGQRDRRWVSGAGAGLYCSILLPGTSVPTQWPFVLGLACHDALDAFAPGVGLKWVNDLVARGKKLGGILVEGNTRHVIGGIGINLAPQGVPESVSLAELGGVGPSRDAVLELILGSLDTRYEQWQAAGFEPLRREWKARSVTLGEDVTVIDGESRKSGIAEDLGPNGELLLREPSGGLISIISGTVRLSSGAYTADRTH